MKNDGYLISAVKKARVEKPSFLSSLALKYNNLENLLNELKRRKEFVNILKYSESNEKQNQLLNEKET